MTTPAERLRRALPPRPKGGYEPGTVAGDTAAVLNQLDARGTGLTPEETAARDALVDDIDEVNELVRDFPGHCAEVRTTLAALARLDAENTLSAELLVHQMDAIGALRAERDAALAALEQVKTVMARLLNGERISLAEFAAQVSVDDLDAKSSHRPSERLMGLEGETL